MLLGALFDGLFDRLEQLINQARNAGNSVLMQAGVEANLAVQNARTAYLELLDKTMDEVDQSVRSTISQLQSMVNSVLDETFASLDDLMVQSQQIVNALPLANTRPQVRSTTPRFIVPALNDYSVSLIFRGNFPQSAEQDKQPFLLLSGGQRIEVAENLTDRLRFDVPVSSLSISQPEANRYSYATVTLSAPWREPIRFPGQSVPLDTSTFKVLIGALPTSPGTIKLSHQVQTTGTEVRRWVTPQFEQGVREGGNNDDLEDDRNHPYSTGPNAGWNLERNSFQFEVLWSYLPPPDYPSGHPLANRWWWDFVSDHANELVWNVTTLGWDIPSPPGGVRWRMQFNESRPVTTNQWVEERINLLWGESRTFSYPAGTWKVVFDAFDGSATEEYTGPTLENPFLKMEDQSGSLRLDTADPATLRWPLT